MSCLITQSIPLNCIDAISGISTCYIGVDIVVSSTTLDSDNQITGLTGSGNLYQYSLAKDTANFVETANISNTNGTAFYSQAFTFNLQKLSADKRNQLLLLSRNRDIKIIFEDNNGQLWFMGKDRGGVTTSMTANSGTAPGDAQNYVVTITSDEKESVYALDSLTSINGITITTV
jgi:hypothetical protein